MSGDYHQLLVHPNVDTEIANDKDEPRRALRQLVRGRYKTLEDAPALDRDLRAALKDPEPGTHDWYDAELLAAVHADAVHGLVTEDAGIHRRARWLGLEDRVHKVEDAVALLGQLSFSRPSLFVPSVDDRPLHSLDLADEFFDSLRSDYPGFDDWFREAARNGRRAFVVSDPEGELAGICVFKGPDSEIGLGRRPGKISTFKVAGEFRGSRYGELLLKVVFLVAQGEYDSLWLTVYERQHELIALLERFGFFHYDDHAGERRYVKQLVPGDAGHTDLSPLDYHVRFGPPAVRLVDGQVFVIPIQPGFHEGLFPDAPSQQMSMITPRPFGNALRKAYLSRANIRSARPGATLLFYRSEDHQAVTAVGVLEDSMVSADADRILAFVGSRTVYSAEEVGIMARQGDVLAFLFRQDRFLEIPIRLHELTANGLLAGVPQTTVTAKSSGLEWLSSRLDA